MVFIEDANVRILRLAAELHRQLDRDAVLRVAVFIQQAVEVKLSHDISPLNADCVAAGIKHGA
jgi:hypothetical protein